MQNAEISSMIDAFGLEVKDGKVIVDESKLRYGKIIITADADVKVKSAYERLFA